MLVITRRIGEGIKIGENISVTIMSLRGSQVKVGVHAPKCVPISRYATSFQVESASLCNEMTSSFLTNWDEFNLYLALFNYLKPDYVILSQKNDG